MYIKRLIEDNPQFRSGCYGVKPLSCSCGEVSRAIPLFFLNKIITVEAFGYTIKGILIHYQESRRPGHLPNVLVIQGKTGRHILRAWQIIKVKA